MSHLTIRQVRVESCEDDGNEETKHIGTSQSRQRPIGNSQRWNFSILLTIMLIASSIISMVHGHGGANTSPKVSMELHHLSIYTNPTTPPTSLSFLLFSIPFDQPLHVQVLKDEMEGTEGNDGDDDDAFIMKPLSKLHVSQLGSDMAEMTCRSDEEAASDLVMGLHSFALSHTLPQLNDTQEASESNWMQSHISSFDAWLIGHDHVSAQRKAQRKEAEKDHKPIREHASLSFILPQVKGHSHLELSRYIRSLSSVRRLLRSKPNTILLAAPVETHLPFYDQVVLFDAEKLLGARVESVVDVVAGSTTATTTPAATAASPIAPWSCSLRFKPRKEQRSWPLITAFLVNKASGNRRSRVTGLAGSVFPVVPPSSSSLALPSKHGIWVSTPSAPVSTILRKEVSEGERLKLARQLSQSESDRLASREDSSSGVISLLDIDAVLGIQGAAVKAVLDPVLKILQEAIADEGEHTDDEETGSRCESVTPSQVLELVMEPLRTALTDGVGPGVSTNIMASLKASMTEYLSTYIHDEVTHDSTPPLYQAVTEILEKHVKDKILEIVPPAIRKHVPITLSNRLGRSLTHSIPPSLTHMLKIAHSPALQYFCHRCVYHDAKKYSLFKPLSPGMSKSGYEQKAYCELCHSSAERMYYHNYHAAYYADYYSDYYIPYFTQSLVEMENKRTGKDNAYNRPAETKIKFDGADAGGGGGEGGEE